jgi:hypothetical protein
MARKLNCWEFKKCGREKGGVLVDILGECPVSTAMKYDGLNDGIGAGRACWMVPDAACRTDATLQPRLNPCHTCEFYRRVVFEEEDNILFKYTSVPV